MTGGLIVVKKWSGGWGVAIKWLCAMLFVNTLRAEFILFFAFDQQQPLLPLTLVGAFLRGWFKMMMERWRV